jgi:CRISPR-associated endonuclease/helicase Cas3
VAHTPTELGEWHLLEAYLSDVAVMALNYAAKLDCDELGYYAGLWHDLGEYHPKFRQYLECCHLATEGGQNRSCRTFPHSVYGACLAAEHLKLLVPIIWGHHAGLPDQDKLKGDLIKAQQEYQEVLKHVPEHLLKVRAIDKSRRTMKGLSKVSSEMLIRIYDRGFRAMNLILANL